MEDSIHLLVMCGNSAMKVEIYNTSNDGKVIELLEPIPFAIKGREYVVPQGYRSNGFSCPRFLWGILSPAIDPNSLVASIIHDWIFDTHVLTRAQADRYFRKRLIEDGFPRWKAELSYIGVRVFGGSHYSKSK